MHEQQQTKPFHGRVMGHFRQQDVYSVNFFFVPLYCSTVSAIRLALANHDGDANENVTTS